MIDRHLGPLREFYFPRWNMTFSHKTRNLYFWRKFQTWIASSKDVFVVKEDNFYGMSAEISLLASIKYWIMNQSKIIDQLLLLRHNQS